MSDNKDDLLSQWLNRIQSTPKVKKSSELLPLNDSFDSEPLPAGKHVQPPLLSGKLAEFLATQQPRTIRHDLDMMTSKNIPFEIKDIETRAVVAMAIILTSHLTRFGATTLDEHALLAAREQIMRTFCAHDAVRIEVEAYDLLNWFAGVMNNEWAINEPVAPRDESQCLQNHIATLHRAIEQKCDLEMRYYTSMRGEFSTRRITPIEIDAEKYLIAYCHIRKENRRFKLTRIISLTWIDNPECIAPAQTEPKANEYVDDKANEYVDDKMYEEDDLRELTAQTEPENSNASKDSVEASIDSMPSECVVLKSGVWVPESQAAEVKSTQESIKAEQPSLPGLELNTKKSQKQKRNSTGFLPGFEPN